MACDVATYCCTSCQQIHWHRYKQECVTLRDAARHCADRRCGLHEWLLAYRKFMLVSDDLFALL